MPHVQLLKGCRPFALQTLLAAVAASAAIVSAAAQSVGTVRDCAAAYHAALSEIDANRGAAVANAVEQLRAADPALPGRWIYAQGVAGRQSRSDLPPDATRNCAEAVKIGGRVRCRRFGATEGGPPPRPAELTISPNPTAAELRVFKAVGDLVNARGAIPDVGSNGRQRWLAERASTDLKAYISQPPHPGICSGASEVAEFYERSLQPLSRRAVAVTELVATARALAVDRIKAISPEQAAIVPTDASGVPKTLIALLVDATRPILGEQDIASIAAEAKPVAALQRAKPALIDAQVAALASGDETRKAIVLAVGRAVRQIEGAAYAEIYAQRYKAYADAVIALPALISQAHQKSCTCPD